MFAAEHAWAGLNWVIQVAEDAILERLRITFLNF